uniref:Uncharacterized protein n=1 Tax=Strigamia maritima TaxID=126957 RepID=T1JBF8_STRMM
MEVYIAGFFPFGHQQGIGLGVLPAVKLALQHINDDPKILTNHHLGIYYNDTKRASSIFRLLNEKEGEEERSEFLSTVHTTVVWLLIINDPFHPTTTLNLQLTSEVLINKF